jgi:hypothetical protein
MPQATTEGSLRQASNTPIPTATVVHPNGELLPTWSVYVIRKKGTPIGKSSRRSTVVLDVTTGTSFTSINLHTTTAAQENQTTQKVNVAHVQEPDHQMFHCVTDGGTYSIKMVNVLDIRGTP